jgi:hypothetical protein
MGLLLAFLAVVVVIALAIALAPYIFGLLGVALGIAAVLAVIGLILVAFGAVEKRFAKWFDNTRFANWQAAAGDRVEAKRQARWDRAEAKERASSVGSHAGSDAHGITKP